MTATLTITSPTQILAIQTGSSGLAKYYTELAEGYAGQTADDAEQTGLDAQATTADRVQTGLDRTASETARAAAESAASVSVSGTGLVQFPSYAALTADETIGYTGSGADIEVAEGNRIDAGGLVCLVAGSAATDHHFTNSFPSPVKLKYLAGIPSHDITLRVGEHFDTMQQAFTRASALHPSDAKKVIISIDSGFSPEAGIMGIDNGDYSHIFIRSVDATVNLASNFSGDFLRGENSGFPVLDCLADMAAAQALGNGRHGYHIDRAGRGYIPSGRGVINCTENGLWVRRNCQVTAQGTKFGGAGTNAGRVTHGGRADLRGADFSNHYGAGPQTEATFDRYIIECDRGYIDGAQCDLSGGRNDTRGISAQFSSHIQMKSSDISGIPGTIGIVVDATSSIDISGTSIGTSLDDFEGDFLLTCRGGGKIIAAEISATNCAGEIFVGAGGFIDINDATIEFNAGDAIENNGGYIYADGATINCRGTLLTSEGGRNDFRDADIDKLDAETGINDTIFKVLNGSTFNGEGLTVANGEHQIVRCYASHANIQNAALGKTAATQASGQRAITISQGGFVCAHGATGVAGAALQNSDTNTTLNSYGSSGVVLA